MTTRLKLDFILPGKLQTKTGGYIYDRRIVEGLKSLGWEVSLHCLDPSFPFPTVTALAHARKIFSALHSGNLVIIDGLALSGMPDLLKEHMKRLRLIGLIHHPLALESGLSSKKRQILYKREKQCLKIVKRTFVTSEWTKKKISDLGIPSNKIRVVIPGTDKATLTNRAFNGLINMLCVATLTPRKGHSLLFEAVAKLPKDSWHLTCIGSLKRDIPTVKKLRAQLKRLKLIDNVTLLGEISSEELSIHYQNTDLFVLTSHLEGYGMVLAEAVARGLPIICTDAGAISSTPAGRAAMLIPEGDLNKLTKALLTVTNEVNFLKQLANRSISVRNDLPTWDQSCEKFSAYLREIS